MKRTVFIPLAILLGFCAVVLNSCRKDDASPPVITLNGETVMHVPLNKAFVDPGIVVTDDIDGTDVYTSDYTKLNPNTNVEGTYYINYATTDNAGNSTHATRTVIVVNEAKSLAGLYNVYDYVYGKNAGSYTYVVTVSASINTNNQLYLSNFGGLGGTVIVTAVASGDSLFLSPAIQVAPGMPTPGQIKGAGTITSGKVNAFNYTITYGGGGTDQAYSFWSKM